MAAGIATAKAGHEAQREALEREIAGLHQQIRERDEAIAHLADQVAGVEAARAVRAAQPAEPAAPAPAPAAATAPAAAAAPPPPPAPPLDPAAAARAAEAVELDALAIYAREPGAPEKGSRMFWRRRLDQLGRHLAPDASPGDQQRAAMADERGKVFVAALQQCRN